MSWLSGMWFPYGTPVMWMSANGTTLDATGEYVAVVGRISISGKGTNKTLDTTGSSSIRFNVAANPVFDNASSVFTVGFQGVDKTTGFPVRPDGTWTARAVITTAADTTPTLTTTSATGHVIVPTAGTVTLSHGDEVCFVYEMTTRAGTDSVVNAGVLMSSNSVPTLTYPATVTNVSGSAAGVVAGGMAVVITFSDGTLGTIDAFFPGQSALLSWADATNPDEQGLGFQVPFACTIDAVSFFMRIDDATSDMQFDLVSDPAGTPASLISGPITLTGENLAVSGSTTQVFYELPSDVSLSANTTYVITVKATGAGSIRWNQLTIGAAGVREFLGPGGTTIQTYTRNGGSGAYTAGSTTVLNPPSVRISGITAGGSGGGLRLAGHGGLAA